MAERVLRYRQGPDFEAAQDRPEVKDLDPGYHRASLVQVHSLDQGSIPVY